MAMKLRWLAALVMLCGCMLAVAPAADDKKPDKAPPDKKPDEVIEDAMAAYKMAEFGRENKSPEALIAAAGMLRSLKRYKLNAFKDSEKAKVEGDGKTADEKTKTFAEEADELFEEATVMGLSLKEKGAFVEVLIKAAKEREYDTRGAIGGPRTICRTIAPKQTHSFHFDFEPNMPCIVGFKGTVPMLVTVVRHDNDHVYAAATLLQGVSRTVTGGSRTGKVPITIRIENQTPRGGTYQLFVN